MISKFLNIFFYISDNEHTSRMILMYFIPLTAIILQFIGLIRKNHFLLIPYLTTSFAILFLTTYVLVLYLITVRSIFLHIEEYLVLGFLISETYFAIYNIILYRKYSQKYNLELTALRMFEPTVKFSELVNERVGIME